MKANKTTAELIEALEKLQGEYKELLEETEYAIKNLKNKIQELKQELYQENKKYEITWRDAGFERRPSWWQE